MITAGAAIDGLFVVVPAYNEGKRIGAVLEDLRQIPCRVVVVDDASPDDTAAVAKSHGAYVLSHAVNRGQGAALQTGITFAVAEGARYVVTFDADGQHRASDMPALLAPVVAGNADISLGNRFLREDSNVPVLRRAVLHLARLFTRVTSGLWVGDAHNGYRAMSRDAACAIQLRQDRMAHASEIYDQIKKARLRFVEVPVTITYTPETLMKGQRLSNSLHILFHYFYGKIEP